jgi:hypothetical protein
MPSAPRTLPQQRNTATASVPRCVGCDGTPLVRPQGPIGAWGKYTAKRESCRRFNSLGARLKCCALLSATVLLGMDDAGGAGEGVIEPLASFYEVGRVCESGVKPCHV